VTAGAPVTASDPLARACVLAATIAASAMVFVDATVVHVALPVLQRGLGASPAQLQWIVNAYTLLLGALLLLGGAAGDRFGRRRVFCLGLGVFGLASLACALAPDAGWLIAARALQGLGGALLVPGSLAIISASFPRAERGRAIGTWAAASALTTAAGPALGGWLIELLSWRAVFWLNLPLAALAVGLALRSVPADPPAPEGRERALDWPGALLATLGFGALTYGLIALGDGATGRLAAGAMAAGVLLLLAFLAQEARAPAPMMPLALFRSRAFAVANLLTLLLYAALIGTLFLLPFLLMRVQGYGPAAAGSALLPFSLLIATLSRPAGALLDRQGPRRMLTLGPLLAAAGIALLALPGPGAGYWSGYLPGLLLLGLGMAACVAPLTTTVMNAVDDAAAGTASGINNAASRIAGLVAVAAVGALALRLFPPALEAALTPLDLEPALTVALLTEADGLGGARLPAGLPADLAERIAVAARQALATTYRALLLGLAACALAAGVVAALLLRREKATSGS